MTKVAFHTNIPFINRDDFLTPFDKIFDQMVSQHYPEITKSVGVNPNARFSFIQRLMYMSMMIK